MSHKIEFKNLSEGNLEIRYFDYYKDLSYRSWILPENVAVELISWWKKLMKDKGYHLPVKEKGINCEFAMHTEDYIEIKGFDSMGRFKWKHVLYRKILLKN